MVHVDKNVPADKPVGDCDLAVLALPADPHLEAPGEVLEDVAVEGGVQLLLRHGQDVVQDVLPRLRVQHCESGNTVSERICLVSNDRNRYFF
jgi:hypothetical protein